VSGGRIDIGSFEVQLAGPALPGDYNQNGTVDAADYVVWRKTLGTSVTPPFTGADGDGDSSIGPGDYDVWTENFGETVQLDAATEVSSMIASGAAIAPVDESTGSVTSMRFSVGNPNKTAELLVTNNAEQVANRKYPSPLLVPTSSPFAPYRPALRGSLSAQRTIAASQRDEALVAWLASYSNTKNQFEDSGAAEMRTTEDVIDADVINVNSLKQVFAQLARD
jgi:hypothetical protein